MIALLFVWAFIGLNLTAIVIHGRIRFGSFHAWWYGHGTE
jgi:hypothetical protein